MKRQGLRAFVAAVLAGFVLACAPMTTQQEVATGREAARQVETEMGVVDDPELEAYVRAIGARLAALSPRQDLSYDFHVVDMPEPNAFALPGGHIYVSRGLLALTNSEDELANVIGHEIGHVAARHHAQQQARAQQVGVLSVLGTLAAAVLGGAEAAQTAGQLGQVAGAGFLASYSRDQERQADEIGQGLAARAGWDPNGMATFLNTLGRETALASGGKRNPGWLDTHPATPERVQTSSARAKTLVRAPAHDIAPTRAAFLAKLDGLVVDGDPAAGVFDGNVFRHPDLNFRLAFPSGWMTANSPAAVAAAPQDRSAVIQLALQAQGSDPRTAAQSALGEAGDAVVREGPTNVGNQRAYQARLSQDTQQGRVGGLFTWIASNGRIYRLECMSSEARFDNFQSVCLRTVSSFGPLSANERDAIRVHVLRVVRANAGETVLALASRIKSAWSPERTAIANALEPGTRLEAGRPVKVAVAAPYQRPRSSAAR
jgi:predicted Zn-dependent protease